MNKVYVFYDWMPEPASEYGGMHVVVATSADEAAALVVRGSDPHYFAEYPNYMERIHKRIAEGKVITADDLMTSGKGFIESFLT